MTPLAKDVLLAALSLLKGSFSGVARPECEKSPERSEVVGTIAPFSKKLVICRRPWYEKKKKALSFLIGPPMAPPNWLRRSGGVGVMEPQLFAFRTLFRRNSNREP